MQLKVKFPTLTDELLYELISELDNMKVLSTPKEIHESTTPNIISKELLPKTFKMISPLWGGWVYFKRTEGLLGYEDENKNLRLWANTEKDLIKKVKKYKKD